MIRINLLPHRQEKRAQRKRQMAVGAVLAAGIGVVIGLLGHTYFSGRVDVQRARNAYLTEETKKLDEQIEKINGIKEQTQDLLARKQVVEGLQTNRSEAVHLLDQLVRQLPEGMWIKSVKQTGQVVNIIGYAQTNGRISTLMRNVDASQWLEKPELVEIKAVILNNNSISEFSLNVRVKRPEIQVGDEPGKADRKKKKDKSA
ncbi:MAG: PilN domain-containing protein [Pseudomonadota bacterium]|nr:PilN domain-containing protein [Pseudomonadota bacterium]